MSSVRGSSSLKFLRQLEKDSEEITQTLDRFLAERNRINQIRIEANKEYDQEMIDIGEISDPEELEEETEKKRDVDHNLMRHLNVNKDSNDYNNYETEEFEFDDTKQGLSPSFDFMKHFNNSSNYLQEESTNKDIYTKKVVPDEEAKHKIRDKLFNFLDESKLEELELVCFILIL